MAAFKEYINKTKTLNYQMQSLLMSWDKILQSSFFTVRKLSDAHQFYSGFHKSISYLKSLQTNSNQT